MITSQRSSQEKFLGFTSIFLVLTVSAQFYVLAQPSGLSIIETAQQTISGISTITWNTIHKIKYLSDDDTSIVKGHIRFSRFYNKRFLLHVQFEQLNAEQFLTPDSCININPLDSTVYVYLKEHYPDSYFVSSSIAGVVADVLINIQYEEVGKASYNHFFATAESIYNSSKPYVEKVTETEDSWEIKLDRESDTLRIVINKSDYMPIFGEHYLTDEGESQYISYTFDDISFDPDMPSITQRLNELPEYYNYDIRKPKVRDPLEAGALIVWKGQYLDGEMVSSADFAGKYTLLKFTYRTCGWCQKAIPMTNKIISRFTDLVVIGLNPYDKEKPEKLREHIKKKNINYPIVFINTDITKQLKIAGYPTFYLVGKDGTLLWQLVGYPDDEKSAIGEIGAILQDNR